MKQLYYNLKRMQKKKRIKNKHEQDKCYETYNV